MKKHTSKKASKLGGTPNAENSKTSASGDLPLDGDVNPRRDLAAFATAEAMFAQFPADVRFTSAQLHNIQRESGPDGQPWIPAPVAGAKRDTLATIAGLLRRAQFKATRPSDLPDSYANMGDMEARTGIPKRAIQWALKHGAPGRDAANRIQPRPILDTLRPVLEKIFGGNAPNLAGIDGLEEWDKDTELAKKLRTEREKLEEEALLRRGTMLLTQDRQAAIDSLTAEEIIEDQLLRPLRAALLAAPKTLKRQLRTHLAGHGLTADHIRAALAPIDPAFIGILDKLRSKIPPRKVVKENVE